VNGEKKGEKGESPRRWSTKKATGGGIAGKGGRFVFVSREVKSNK